MDDWAFYLKSYVVLKWDERSCGDCEMRGADCGFVGDAGLQVGCFNFPRHGMVIYHKIKRNKVKN